MTQGDLRFGTGGLRATMGDAPWQMNENTIRRASAAVLEWLGENRSGGVALGYDSRNNSRAFAMVAADVFSRGGAPVYMTQTPAPTPLISFSVRRLKLAAGIMITASHNPPSYNGYKVYGSDGGQILEEDAAVVAKYITMDLRPSPIALTAEIRPLSAEVEREYIDMCRALAVPDADFPGISVVYTPLHGAAGATVLKTLGGIPGVKVYEVDAQARPDGNFPTCPKPNPEDPETFRLAIREAKRVKADIALANDPDGDRVAVAAPDKDGNWRVFTGNETGALLLEKRLSQWRGSKPPLVVKTFVTTDLAVDIVKAHEARLEQVPTGFKYIGSLLKGLEKRGQTDSFAFAMEESCGFLADPSVHDKDGVQGCVMLCGLAREAKSRGETLDQALEALYKKYGYVLTKLCSWPSAKPNDRFDKLIAGAPKTLLNDEVTLNLTRAGLSLKTRRADAILRPSGTEPFIKAYLSVRGAEANETRQSLAALSEEISAWVENNSEDF